MSFFNSLQEYVSNSVANLSLGTKKLSLSRSDNTETTNSQQSSSANLHGFPKVLPTPGASPMPPQLRKVSVFENRIPSPSSSIRRQGSFRQQSPQPPIVPPSPNLQRRGSSIKRTPPVRHTFNFCTRRSSWPEIDIDNTSEIQEYDNGYFESFTALAWKHQNHKQNAMKYVETRAKQVPPNESDLGVLPIDNTLSPDELTNLYVEMLYTITNSVGAPAPGGQYSHFKDDLLLYGRKAFRMPSDQHFTLLQSVGEEKPPIIVLSVAVIEAEGLEAKDANGFSDPYCMLGIRPKEEDASQSFGDNSSHIYGSNMADIPQQFGSQSSFNSHEKSRKHHHSFRLSFKRKDTRNREQRDSINNLLPAKYIRATTVKPNTLNPKWNEKFRFDIEDINSESLHLDIWDHDDESSVFEAVRKLNEVRGVRGLGRYFKQVCQSARQNSQDDFLGCITIPLRDIPSTGLESWFKLDARSDRSTVQGRIRLKLWLSTREDRSASEDDNWEAMMQHDKLCMIFIDYELSIFGNKSWVWSGELSGEALTILHQHAVQSDLTELQRMMCLWMAVSKVCLKTTLNFRWILKLLSDLEHLWPTLSLSRESEAWLANSFKSVLEKWFLLVCYHRQLFPALHNNSLHRLEFLLKCLAFVGNMKAFWKCCPFSREIRGEIIAAIRKGTIDWYSQTRSLIFNNNENDQTDYKESVALFLSELQMELEHGFNCYHSLFDEINRVPYFTIIFKQVDVLLFEEIDKFLKEESNLDVKVYHSTFLALFTIKDFLSLAQHYLQNCEQKFQLNHCFEWFEPVIEYWLTSCKDVLLQRVEMAVKLNKEITVERCVKHSTSTVDLVTTFCHLRDFWHLLHWPKSQSIQLVGQLLDLICSASILYADHVSRELTNSGYFDVKSAAQLSAEMCIAVNNLEYVRNFLSHCYKYFDVHSLDTIMQQSQLSDIVPLSNHLTVTIDDLNSRISNILKRIPVQIENSLKKLIFHLAWSPECLPTNQAIEPLFEYLYNHLQMLNVAMLRSNFQKVLIQIWETTLTELDEQLKASEKNDEKPPTFYDRLCSALELIVQFFDADGQGVSGEHLKSKMYFEIGKRLEYYRTDTEALIEMFYNQRLEEQLMIASMDYGVLAVRAHFSHDSLCVEVLYAKDVIPLDPNGYSDPFVIIELLPSRIFPNCNKQQTNVHKRTLNPVFDECFEFPVTWEQCSTPGAMVAFVLMDYDVITANDFGGEAFLSLGNVSGISDGSATVDNFHGLKIIELPLMPFNDRKKTMQVGWMDKYKGPIENHAHSDLVDCAYPREDIVYNTSNTCFSSAPVIPTSNQYGLVIVPNDPVNPDGDVTIVSTVEKLKGVDTIVTVMSSPTPATKDGGEQAKDDQRTTIVNNRFKVVKIETTVPFKRGRWTCMDYLDHNDNSTNVVKDLGAKSSDFDSKVSFSDAATTKSIPPKHKPQSFVSTQTAPNSTSSSNVHILSCTSEATDDSSPEQSVITTTAQSAMVSTKPRPTFAESGASGVKMSSAVSNGIATIPEIVDNETADVAEANSSEQADQPVASGTDDSGEANNPVAIDNKIEQAMDLVKSHLMYAVREEVEVLKERIAELMDRINQLEVENVYLKSHVSADILSKIPIASQNKMSTSSTTNVITNTNTNNNSMTNTNNANSSNN